MPPLCARINTALVLKKDVNNDQGIGRSKGGLSTENHITCDALGNPTEFHLTAGQDHDLERADILMNKLTKAEAVLADKAYERMNGCGISFKKKMRRGSSI